MSVDKVLTDKVLADKVLTDKSAKFEEPNSVAPTTVPVIDYEGSGYRRDFWEGQGREYEDAAERIALRRLLPRQGGRIAEIGAGFGRLADLYLGYDQIVLFDNSRTMLADAVRKWGHDERFIFVAGNLYQMPLANGTLDALVMVRVMHHLADVPAALSRLQPLLHRRSAAVLEYANKRNLKAVLRWLIGRKPSSTAASSPADGDGGDVRSPFDPTPLEFVAMNFDFHPDWMAAKLKNAGLRVDACYGVSHFRLRALKRRAPAQMLARLDSFLFRIGGKFPLAPSVFVRTAAPRAAERAQFEATPRQSHAIGEAAAHSTLFRCPACAAHPLAAVGPAQLQCPSCARRYGQKDCIWDFKLAA